MYLNCLNLCGWISGVIVAAVLNVTASAAIVGSDGFAYPDGMIAGTATLPGDGWSRNSAMKSDWSGDASVSSQTLITDGTKAWRAFGDPRTTAAYQGGGVYFWKIEFTYDGASEVVVSSSDFGTAKINWGVIGGGEVFGIEIFDESGGGPAFDTFGLVPVVGQKYLLAGKLDFDNDELTLWVNPEPGSEFSPSMTLAYTGDDWSSGIMLGSSADGTGVGWDDLEVADSFADLNLPVITPPFTLPELTISEFMASNTQINDPDGASSDWLEILNATGRQVDLGGWFLTDSPTNLTKWAFPSHSLAHNARLIVWASGKDRTASSADLHTNFKLSASNEYLALVKPDGVTIAKDYTWGTGQPVTRQYADVSYGTFGSAQAEDYFAVPTPSAANMESPFVAFTGSVIINEFVATAAGVAPSTGITDAGLADAPTFSDWVELHNPGAGVLDLSGCHLTDDSQRKARWRFPAGTTIDPGGYLVVLADGADAAGDYLHTNFSIGAAGGYLRLSDPNGVLLDEFSPSYPQQVAGYSYGHAGYYETPTPGVMNGSTALSGIVAAPTFNVLAGFHDQELTTTVSSATIGATVHTELGAAEPGQSSPTTATFASAPGEVLLIRARAYAAGMVPSPIVSATYIMNASAAEKSMPAMHFVGDDYATFWDLAGGGSNLGIIDNYDMRGRIWERPINLELHYPDGATPSQALSAGVRYAGHGDRPQFFRETNAWDYEFARPQFNLFFRSEYGESSWDHDLFPGLTDVIDHDSLRVRLDRGLVDEFIRRLWVDMGNHGSLGTLTTLYVNGLLRTVANPVQRIREPLLQEWYNTKNEFDVLAVFDFPSGEEFAYAAMEDYFEDTNNDFTQLATYQSGGEMLDYVNYADYMLLLSYMATTDWPENNKHAARERALGEKFRFYVWDAQQSMTDGNAPAATEATIDRLLTADDTTIKVLSAVKDSDEFKLLWADRIQKHFFNGGALTNPMMDGRWFGLSNAINPIFDQFWMESVDDSLYTDWRDTRLPFALANYKTHGLWFDDLLAPTLSQQGGAIDGASELALSNPTSDPQFTAMTIFYTMDGSDPRVAGGEISPVAIAAGAAPLVFGAGGTTLRARVYDAITDRWSPCNEAEFQFVGSKLPLVVSEIFYNPPGKAEGEEFIELLNISESITIDLSGYSFTRGIVFTFPSGVTLAPGARIVIAKDIGLFTSSYGVPPVGMLFGPYAGLLANGGERIVFSAPDGARVIDFTYDDSSSWPQSADGDGRSLELLVAAGNPDASAAASWGDGLQVGGSPGYVDVMSFATWKSANSVVVDDADGDGDGISNFLEYAFGTDPNMTAQIPVAEAVDVDGYITFTFRKNLAAKDLGYTVELSDDLSSWQSGTGVTVLVSVVRNGDGTSTETHRSILPVGGGARRFVRVKVVTVP
ncbi:MAG: hypothetical protein ACI8XO_001030 [Verrucomicrobiales bacterium]|jgi:hypothetical protein